MNLQVPAKAGFFRPTFQSQYSTPRNARHKVTDELRLGDLLEFVAPIGSDKWLENADESEFEVIDAFKREKGFFEFPVKAKSNPDLITALIEAHFDSPAMRLGKRQWMV